MRSFLEIKDFGLRRLPIRTITLQEVEILLTLACSSLLGQKYASFEFQLNVLRLRE